MEQEYYLLVSVPEKGVQLFHFHIWACREHTKRVEWQPNWKGIIDILYIDIKYPGLPAFYFDPLTIWEHFSNSAKT
jgi:hypothetical protein